MDVSPRSREPAPVLAEQAARALAQWPFLPEVEARHGLPEGTLLAVGSRETGLRNIIGDGGHGFGVFQRDNRWWPVDASYLNDVRRQANDAATLLAANRLALRSWGAALAAYNAGLSAVKAAILAGLSPDSVTTGLDYAADVLGRLLLINETERGGTVALTGPQKIPFAVTSGSSWYGDNYTGTPFEANVGVIHTTEGTSLPSYDGGASAPNVTGVPNFNDQTIKWYQHFDVDRSSRALRNASGGVETNQLNAFQVELVGTCDPRTRDNWREAGRSFIYWPDAPDWALKEVAKLVRWLSDNHKIQIKSTVTWRPYPSSYGQWASQRLTGAQWENYYGWLGHQHVPENDHGDPGDIDFDRVIQFALGEAPTGGEDVALSAEDIEKVADRVVAKIFAADVIPAVAPPDNNADWDTNKTWSFKYAVHTPIVSGRETLRLVKALEAKVDALTAGGVDVNALAAAVVAKLVGELTD